ncbi:MAG: TraB/GumN family protein, partial [Sphingomicrobium sp.]
MMIKALQRFVAPVTALLALGSTAQAKAPQAARPALWSVSDADTTVYLFGTIHLLPEKVNWRTEKFDAAVSGSHELVVETIIDDKNPAQLMSVLAKLAITPGLPPIAERVPPEKRAALAEAIKKSAIPPAAFDRMETWAAAFMLLGNQFKDAGLKGGEGVEAVLRSSFMGQGKPIGELETNAEQLGFFDALPENAQRQLLEGAIESPGDTKKEFGKMLDSWTKGDVAAIARVFNHDLAGSPELMDALIKRRNANWSKWIEQRMTKPGAVMIAVGAGHLAGPGSVVDLLQRDGFKVHRVQ